MLSRVRIGLFCAASALAIASPARAAEPRAARLVYARGDLAHCPDEVAMKSTVSARLGYDPFDADAAQVIVTATITRGVSGLEGRVTLHDSTLQLKGSRVLTTAGDDCAELASAMALAISIAIDPLSVTRPALPSGEVPASTPVATGAAVPAMDPRPPTSPDRGEVRAPSLRVGLRLGADASAAFGATPGTSVAPGALVGFSLGRWSFDLEGRGHLETSAEAPKGRVSASLLLVSLVPCLHAGIAVACAMVGVGRLVGTGSGVDVPESDATLYANAGARLGVEFRLFGQMSARLHGEALVPLVSTELLLRGVEVWSTPAITAALGAGVLARFP